MYSVVNGIVVDIFYTSICGNTVVVRDSENDYLFLHLYKIDVSVGQEVSAGERIRWSWNNRKVYSVIIYIMQYQSDLIQMGDILTH